MIAFRISINGKQVSVAGVGSEGLLAAMVTWSKGIDPKNPQEDCHIQVTGARGKFPLAAETVVWLMEKVRLGDSITIEVIDLTEVDTPQMLGPAKVRT